MIGEFLDYRPLLGKGVYVAPAAVVIGRVKLGAGSSVWPGAVLRGDLNGITVGEMTNLQDLVVGHVEKELPLVIGAYVTVGHGAILHACTVGDAALIGMGAIVLNGATVGEGAVLGAGSILPPGKTVPPRAMALGSPARVIRQLSEDEVAHNRKWAEGYADLAAKYTDGDRGPGR